MSVEGNVREDGQYNTVKGGEGGRVRSSFQSLGCRWTVLKKWVFSPSSVVSGGAPSGGEGDVRLELRV